MADPVKETLAPGALADVCEWLAKYGLVVVTAEEFAELSLYKNNAVMGAWHRAQKAKAQPPDPAAEA